MKKMIIDCRCPFCGGSHCVVVPEIGFEAWQSGELIQNALPMLTPTEREQMISGICPKCQNSIFAEDDDSSENEDIDSNFHLVYEDEDSFLAEVDTDLSDEDFLEMINSL